MSLIYRMPVGFGPSQGPRQGPDGRRFNGELSKATILTIEYLTDEGAMAALLPPGVFGRSYAIGVGGPVPRLEQKEAVIVAHLRGEIERLKGEA